MISTQRVIFEAFEASPLSEEVLATKIALQWDFPGSAVAIPLSVLQDPIFQEELATFLEKASTESIKRFAARTNKAGSFAVESRDTVEPALITQMLMTLLETIGTRIYPTVLRKRIRDDVSWNQGAKLPWRRCPFWLVLRVGVERHLRITVGGDIGRLYYKMLIILVLTRLLDESFYHIALDLSALLKTKICRRIVKIAADKGKASPVIQSEYERMFILLMPDLDKSTSNATTQINKVWESFKRTILRPILTLPKYADARHLQLTLPNSEHYLRQILSGPLTVAATNRPLVFALPKTFQTANAAAKPGMQFAEDCFRLSKLETDIKMRNAEGQPAFSNDEDQCNALSIKIEEYLNQVGASYDQNPEQMSIVLLTVMEIWMLMDLAAVRTFPILKEFSPGFPTNILDVLQVPKHEDMTRLVNIRKYLNARHILCNDSKMTIFVDPRKGCFAERYYDQSPDSGRLQRLHHDIELTAAEDRNAKEEEWKEKTNEYTELVRLASEASCVYEVDAYGNRTHIRRCQKCFLDRKVANFRIEAHEHPLPADLIQAKVVVFELGCPKAFAAYRDSTWRILSRFALQADPAATEPRLLLKDYGELSDYSDSM